jgi:hypothetical protein
MYTEICTVISKLKSNNAGGADNIPPELIIKKKEEEELRNRNYIN